MVTTRTKLMVTTESDGDKSNELIVTTRMELMVTTRTKLMMTTEYDGDNSYEADGDN